MIDRTGALTSLQAIREIAISAECGLPLTRGITHKQVLGILYQQIDRHIKVHELGMRSTYPEHDLVTRLTSDYNAEEAS